jgi:hypothetical protein
MPPKKPEASKPSKKTEMKKKEKVIEVKRVSQAAQTTQSGPLMLPCLHFDMQN